jgi:hypothetical protein
MKTNSNYKVLVDFHTKVTPHEKHKIIFSRDGQTTLWFKIKKFFMQKEMQIASAKYIKNIFEEYSTNDKTYVNPFRNISEVDGLDENLVIDAFVDLEKRKKFNLPTQNLLIELDYEKSIINAKLNNSDSVTLNKDILLLAQNNCTTQFSSKTITESLSYLDKIDKNDLSKINYKNSSNILIILNHLKEKILVNPDDTYIKKVSAQIDSHIKLLTPHSEKLKENIENKANKEACETRVKKIIEHKNKIAATLSRHIPAFKNNNKALTAFIIFLENPTASFKPTREISTRDTLENLIEGPTPSLHENYKEKKLEEFIAIFADHASNLPTSATSDACFDAVDYLTGSLLDAVNSGIRFDPMYSSATEQVDLKSALRKNWEQYGPSGFLLHLLNYDKSGIDAIDHRSYLTLNHLLKDHQRLAQITHNLPESLQAGFSKKMQSLENDLALFKENSEQVKIDKRAEYKASVQRKMIIEDEVESREDLPRKQDRLLNTNVARTKVTDSIKGILTNIAAFKENNEIIPALTSFIVFLNTTNDFSFNKNNKRDLDQFFVIFFDHIKTLTPDHRMLCLKEVDVLEGMLLQYENNDVDKIDISKIGNEFTRNLAKAIQDNAHAAPPSGNLSHLLFYLKDGKSSINLINYWGLQYFCQSQHTQLKDSLHEPLRSYFQTQIEQLRKDLADLKPVYQARTT